jgi:hypothetical protein
MMRNNYVLENVAKADTIGVRKLPQKKLKLTGVGIGDLVDFIGIEPNLSLTTLEDASG